MHTVDLELSPVSLSETISFEIVLRARFEFCSSRIPHTCTMIIYDSYEPFGAFWDAVRPSEHTGVQSPHHCAILSRHSEDIRVCQSRLKYIRKSGQSTLKPSISHG